MEHQNTPRKLIIEAYNLIDDDYLDLYNEMVDKLGIPRRQHSGNRQKSVSKNPSYR